MVKTGAIVIIVLILIAIVVGFFFIFSGDDSTTQEGSGPNAFPQDDENTEVINQVPANQGDDVDELVVVQDDTTPPDEPDDDVSPDEEPEDLPNSLTIDMTDSGFSPSSLQISSGDTVIFSNVGTRGIWPASNVHPSHTSYPGSGASKCNSSPDTIFDACGEVSPGNSYSFTFNEVGTWSYHDHRRSGNGGTIIVN